MTAAPSILWLRQDLRLSDQSALIAAAEEGAVVPVYVLDDETPKHRKMGAASRWWLHHSLASLDAALREKGSRLILRRGKSDEVLGKLAEELGTRRVHAIRHYEPWWRNAERAVAKALDLVCHDGNFLAAPGSIASGAGTPYRIFTPFWRALNDHMPPPDPVPSPHHIPAPTHWPKSESLDDWGLLPRRPNWSKGFDAEWIPGEAGAHERLDAFLGEVQDYKRRRDLPSVEGTSRLSPHLHFGEVSPATIWQRLSERKAHDFLRELSWRDYAQNVILQFPDYATRNGRERFDALPWRDSPPDLTAWQQGRTGYPIVDAGMRQLWATGWMHNRVRMIAASFLVKHLLIDWREGERWFWDTLVDADYGNNSVNWQWIAGTGLDSNQWGRIMAPLLQSEKFDAGAYIRRWVPELADLPDSAVHDPDAAGRRPFDYPPLLIAHREARDRAIAAGRNLVDRN